MHPLSTLKKHGVRGTARLYGREIAYRWACFRTRHVAQYRNPDGGELRAIESELATKGHEVTPCVVESSDFRAFLEQCRFPENYHGGRNTGYWHEKVFEHFLSWRLLDMASFRDGDLYLDIAAGSSPWVRLLREQAGLRAFALDLTVRPPLNELRCYIESDATQTPFDPGSVRGIAMHCAFEMFAGESDVKVIREFARILAPGGMVVIVPLYMHTHYCCYSSPEYWGRGHGDRGAVEYVRPGTRNIPTSRKYDVDRLQERVLDVARCAGLTPQLLVLRNQAELSPEIYCHFVLMLRKQ